MNEPSSDQAPGLQPDEISALRQIPIVFGRTVVPVPLGKKKRKTDSLGFEYAEHSFIGDAINLTLEDGSLVHAHDHKFTLQNGLAVTYGQINGLAGDFYGTVNPISDGATEGDRSRRFMEAYNTLADPSSRQPKEAEDILAVLEAEVKAVNDALSEHKDPSTIYPTLPDATIKFESLTYSRPKNIPDYVRLARINWDHFGHDARTAYNAGHLEALKVAIDGDLSHAYTLNAFADHFLEDSFSAGHLRTPRRRLHKDDDPGFADLCAKYMHDEDNAIGLSVTNSRGDKWTCYGDKRGLDEVNSKNMEYCIEAVQESANEIYEAYKSKALPETYKAWTIAPSLESAESPQELAPLFKFNSNKRVVDRRKVIENRRNHNLTSNWWYATTAFECFTNGWWKYPITIDGPPKKNV